MFEKGNKEVFSCFRGHALCCMCTILFHSPSTQAAAFIGFVACICWFITGHSFPLLQSCPPFLPVCRQLSSTSHPLLVRIKGKNPPFFGKGATYNVQPPPCCCTLLVFVSLTHFFKKVPVVHSTKDPYTVPSLSFASTVLNVYHSTGTWHRYTYR